ncbi:MAG: hypothetical protein V4596_02125 [Bdellovibrionota bacterium]
MKVIFFAAISLVASASFAVESNVDKYLSLLQENQAIETTVQHSNLRTFKGIVAVDINTGKQISNSSCKLEIVGNRLVLSLTSSKGASAISVDTVETSSVDQSDMSGLVSSESSLNSDTEVTKTIGVVKRNDGKLGVLASVEYTYKSSIQNSDQVNQRIAAEIAKQNFDIGCELK